MTAKAKEKWQVYAPNGAPIASDTNDKVVDQIYGIVCVWLYRRTSADLEVLFQQRAHNIDNFPDQWDVSAGGHINQGESQLDAVIREAGEEIGAKIPPEDLIYAFSTTGPKRITHTYLCDWTNRDPVFSFNDHEVQAIQWIALSRIDAFREQYVKAPLAQDNNYFILLKTWLSKNASVQRAVARRGLLDYRSS